MVSAERTAELNAFGKVGTATLLEAGTAWFRARVVLRAGVREDLQVREREGKK
jgi:hypothetical protein